MEYGVTVSPHSSTEASSYAGGGVGPTNFYFGGNPNLAALVGGVSSSPLLWIVGAVVIVMLLRRR